MDAWLRRELAGLYAEIDARAMPCSIGDLARRLEDRLREAERRETPRAPRKTR